MNNKNIIILIIGVIIIASLGVKLNKVSNEYKELLNENKGEKQYYKDPTIKEIEKEKINKNNKQKRKKN